MLQWLTSEGVELEMFWRRLRIVRDCMDFTDGLHPASQSLACVSNRIGMANTLGWQGYGGARINLEAISEYYS
ncbi:hypothetical protein PT2222_220151 [Paraburkholderia tropica]